MVEINGFVFPGDIVTSEILRHGSDYSLGPGLRERTKDHSIIATVAGILKPRKGDFIIGVINDKLPDSYKVDFNSCCPSMMPKVAFDGATKRNAPNLSVGACILARVDDALLEEASITCTSANDASNKKGWATGQSTLGELAQITVEKKNVCFSLTVSSSLIERLSNQISSTLIFSRDNPSILGAFGNAFQFEIALGANGIIWISCESLQHALLLRSVINIAETQNDLTCWLYCEQLLELSLK